MTIQSFIEKAIEGGYSNNPQIGLHLRDPQAFRLQVAINLALHEILLDPLAWKAVGKVEGWSKGTFWAEDQENPALKNLWKNKMIGMARALAEGKTIEEYLETL